MGSIRVTLTDEQIATADAFARQHQADRQRDGSVHRNNRPKDPPKDLINHMWAMRCEYAAHLALGTTHWENGPLRYGPGGKKLADLDHFIDVRARRAHNHQLLVQFDDPPEYAYLSVCHQDHPTYSIDQWCWGREARQDRFIDELNPNRPSYCIPMSDLTLHDPFLLKLRVQERAAASRPRGHDGPTRG